MSSRRSSIRSIDTSPSDNQSERRASVHSSTTSRQTSRRSSESHDYGNVTAKSIDPVVPVPVRRKKKKDRTCVTVGVMCVVVLLFSVGAFVGGYFVRRSGSEDALRNVQNEAGSWNRTSSCLMTTTSECGRTPTLVVLNLSGFRPSFLTPQNSPVLWKLKTCGTFSGALRSVYPTISLVNQYSMVTGLYAESHGIVGEVFQDGTTGRIFDSRFGQADVLKDPSWWKGEPLWITAKRQGKRTGVINWAGGEVINVAGSPDEAIRIPTQQSLDPFIDKVLEWISQKRLEVVLAHLEEPGLTNRRFPQDSPEVKAALSRLDNAMGRLMEGLQKGNHSACTNVVIVSDHGGYEPTTCTPTDVLQTLRSKIRNDTVNDNSIDFFGGTHARLGPSRNGRISVQMAYDALFCEPNPAGESRSPYQLYKKADLPRRLHYTNSPRIEPLVLTPKLSNILTKGEVPACDRSLSGYDNIYQETNGIFLAHGPSFKHGHEAGRFEVVELYNVLCEITGVEPAANNGTWGSLHGTLKNRAYRGAGVNLAASARALFPSTPEELNRRQSFSCGDNPAVCMDPMSTSSFQGGSVQRDLDLRLNISDNLAQKLISSHTGPYGVPRSMPGSETALVVNRDFLLGYDRVVKMPLWATFVVPQRFQASGPVMGSLATCARNDVRFNTGETLCVTDFLYTNSFGVDPSYVVQRTFLVSPDLLGDNVEATDGRTLANVVPMHPLFRTSIWQPFWNMIASWAKTDSAMHVLTGPVFDGVEPFGLKDSPETVIFASDVRGIRLPSHFFVVVIGGWNQTEHCGDSCQPNAISFILPHKKDMNQHSCQDLESYILAHTATVKDVESVTGLRFFMDLPHYEATRLRSLIPTKLWHKSGAKGAVRPPYSVSGGSR